MSTLLKQLTQRVLFFDGAMGTAVHSHDLSIESDYLGRENCPEVLIQTRPQLIGDIHESYLAAGCDAVETNTFGANKLVLAEFDLVDQTYAINKTAAEIARAAADKYTTADKPRYVIGSMGPGTKLITLNNTTWDDLFDSYHEQARGLLDGGIDALLIETAQDLLQVKCAVNACLGALKEKNKNPDCDGQSTAGGVPIMVQVTIETTGTMLLGTEISAAAAALSRYPIMSLGLNCATGPAEMAEHVHWLGRNWPRSISVLPNAGLPELVDGKTKYPLGPEPFAEAMIKFVQRDGVNIVGGCCGTDPHHIAKLVEAVGQRPPHRTDKTTPRSACTSLYSPTDFRQETTILNIGERTNASGSRSFKQLLEAEDWDAMISLAREQVREGSHVIDINVDYAGRDNARDMAQFVTRLVRQVNIPLMLDSTQSATIEAGLRHAGGKCVINSANLEEGEEKFAAMCALANKYGAALVLGTIDEDPQEAMARTADRKFAIAQRMYDLAVNKYKLPPGDLLFDPLVLPISTGMDKDRRSGLETIEGVRRISQHITDSHTVVGLSNVSFGLKPVARAVLNSVFLHELVAAGLHAAIVHVSKILPETKIPVQQWQAALNLIYDRKADSPVTLADGTETTDPLQVFIDLFTDDDAQTATRQQLTELPLEERLQKHIIDGEKQNFIETLEQARKQYSPLVIINDHLLAGMKVVGDLFGSGQMQLPFVLQSAEVMKLAVAHLEQFMEKTQGRARGSIVLATVRGDVHDIGKNLVDIILTNNGYQVHNLGIKQPLANILAAWRQHQVDAIGLSGLLVKSVMVMEENLHELNEQNVDVPVLLGGAALSRNYCEGHLRSIYRGPVYYGKDAFEALRIMNLMGEDRTNELDGEIDQRVQKRPKIDKKPQAIDSVTAVHLSNIAQDIPIPTPPFWGDRVVESVTPDEIYPYINKTALFRGQWQFKKAKLSDDEFATLLENQVEPLFDRLRAQCRDENILMPKIVYGYYPCQSRGNDLVLFDPEDHERETQRFTFPRQQGKKHLCISDFFRSTQTKQKDVIALTCVTIGSEVSHRTRQLFESDQYSEYLYLHGLGVEAAEALAEYWHKRIRQELALADDDSPDIRKLFSQGYRGSRYSFGYPACPDMSDQQKLFGLLRPERIGCTLTENWQIDPEQSTSAIIAHHPEAKYFNV